MQDFKVKEYKINNADPKFLRDNDFHCLSRDSVFYKHSFPVYNWDFKPVLFCEITVNTENANVDIEVVDKNGTAYAPWYNDRYSTENIVVNICNMNIKNKLRKLGIKKESRKNK